MPIEPPITADQLLTLADAAPRVGLSHSHLRTLAKQGRIWTLKLGKIWLTTEHAIRAYRATAPKPGPKAAPPLIPPRRLP